MGQIQRAGHMDVSNTVDVSSASAVCGAVRSILQEHFRAFDFAVLEVLFRDLQRLYEGDYPGFRACDIQYHNLQHVLDVTLAMGRLLDGCLRNPEQEVRLSSELALAGIATALFHDSGYIRRTRDTRHSNGAAYTRVHVSRGARFLASYLPEVGLQDIVGTCTRIIYFTGYDRDPQSIEVHGRAEYLLGTLLGTADLIAQLADIDYAAKCREYLYEEFVAGGLAGEQGEQSHMGTIYRSREQLLSMTPAFIRTTMEVRLGEQFDGVHRYAAEHFGGRHLYMDAIVENCRNLEAMLATEGH
ncbi:MAG: hypothetical protein CME59_14685 [Halioglobus sp.]|nr:hypothetical protein [Halioglobus sp.]|tara:strand:+ start:393 stop:1292 length:900 start_codon:yes stop_codon:yes gene_type:complete